jgi:CRISPR/Cas system-associated exonuclease Cas4 (RecB family)
MTTMIDCSAGKGTMPAQDCLTCAKGALPPCGMDYSLLRVIYGSSEDRRGEIHVTDLTSCLRKAYLNKTAGAVPEKPHKRMAILRGLAFHALMDNGDWESEIPLYVRGDGWEVVGRADTLYETSAGKLRLIDFKTTREIYPDLLPYGEHEVQLNFYAHMMRAMRLRPPDELVNVYVASKTPECAKCRTQLEMTNHGEYEVSCPSCGKSTRIQHLGVKAMQIKMLEPDEVAHVFNHRASTLANALKNKTLPGGEPGWQCKYCSYECDARA